ncbi:MAG: cytochrome P450, partial [Gemmatimonadota bacterium]|nr:cytochrome P450 [Gemmatimonadota bacterium]
QRRLLGNGLLTNENESWLQQRRLAQPAFHRERIAGYGEIIAADTERMLATWEDGEVRDVHSELQRLAVGIVAKTLFGADMHDRAEQLGVALEAAMQVYANRRGLARFIPDWAPLPSHLRYRRGVRDLDATIADIIHARRARDEDTSDLLSMLLRARDEDGNAMNDAQLRDEAVTLFVGGFDTPALGLSWAWYLLAQNREAREEIAKEVDSVLQGRAPRAGDLPRLQYTEMVVKEAMRLYPPAWLLSREAVRDTEIGGYAIPAGTVVMMSQWVMHRDPRYFEEPNEFLPQRWSRKGAATELPRFAYFPFGGGPRVCIGASFAMMEAVLVLATVAQQFEFTLASQSPIVPWPTMTLRPRGGLQAVLTRRQHSPQAIAAHAEESRSGAAC